MMERIIWFSGPVEDHVCSIINAQLLWLHSENDDDINIYINSPGGGVSAGLSTYDLIQYITPDVATTVIGMAASMGAILQSSGTKGKRYALPSSKIMIHQPSGGIEGTSRDMEVSYDEIKKDEKYLYEIIAKNTGQSYGSVRKDCRERDKWFSPAEAKEYGLIDEIVKPKTK